jgi:hypothetical protein
MATTSTSTSIVPVQLVFTAAERLALAGFLAGYTGLTREAYALDLRQYASWCQLRDLRLFQARRAGHRVLCPRSGSEGPGPGHHHPAAVHHRRVL